ncbi:MAG: beta-galactosidase trimerization domain-containing protein [Lentisphaeria bacterium]|nr:beta-galactosidase trimerization domain-containing protein [Lentisphaeria bacterium]NQZ71369.1 beta-galactosidase trimerization domain-containing protein [Lentisphaeria bacterium]
MKLLCQTLFFLLFIVALSAEDKRPIRLIIEGEDFSTDKGWAAMPYRDNYFASTFAITFLSRQGCLSAPAQLEKGKQAIATKTVTIPYDGAFEVLSRYEQPYAFTAEFTIEIVQKGKTVYKKLFGKYDDPKVGSMMGPDPAKRRVPMVRYFWGATDNIILQEGGSAKLKKGQATIRIIAEAQLDNGKPRLQVAKRNIDLIYITNDAAGIAAQKKHCRTYLEKDGWLTQAGDLYLRLTNKGSKPVSPMVTPSYIGQHSPYYIHLRDWPSYRIVKDGVIAHKGRNGRTLGETNYQNGGPRTNQVNAKYLAPVLRDISKYNPAKAANQLQPGAKTGWMDIGQMIDALHLSKWTFDSPGKMTLEFAVPDGKGGLKTVKTITVEKGAITFEMPNVLNPSPQLRKVLEERYWVAPIRTQEEALQFLQSKVKAFKNEGKRPKRFRVYNIMGFGGTRQKGTVLTHVKKLASQLGDNTINKHDLYTHIATTNIKAIDALFKKLKYRLNDGQIISYGDEMHLPTRPMSNDELKQWMKKNKVKYKGDIVYTKDRKHPLYYYSKLASIEKGASAYQKSTAHYAAGGGLTGSNYSPHGNYYVSEIHYIRPFKLKALNMPWSEDYVWQVPEFSVQVFGYLAAGLRAGAKYDNMPLHMYVMPHSPGNTARDFTLAFYTAIANGSKMINYFCASPSAVGGTENYVDTNDLSMWKEIHDNTWAAGVFEDYVMDGKVRPAKVGLLLSSVEDILSGASNKTLAMHNNERKALYLALTHAQIPVDFVSEDDVIDGLCKNYKVIYVTEKWLHSKAINALEKWVKKGGTLVSVAGGGFRNEYDKINPAAGELYGVKSQSIKTDPDLVSKYLLVPNKPFFPKQDLPPYEPIDTVTWSHKGKNISAGVIVWKQKLVPSDGKVIGKYKDGSPAIIEKIHGKGRTVLFGFLPGQAYLKSALPLRPVDRSSNDGGYNHWLPTEMDKALRSAITDFVPADYQRPVVCSEDLVETSCIDTTKPSKRLAVPLMNYSGKFIKALTVKIAGVKKIRSIRSVKYKKVKTSFDGDVMTVTLPLDVADILLIDTK